MVGRGAAIALKAKVCLVGEAAVGKTSLIRRFVLNAFDEEYMRTVGTLISKKGVEVEGEGGRVRVDLVLWDIMGDKGILDLLQEAYFYKANGLLAVADATRPSTVGALEGWIRSAHAAAGPVPTVVLGNKADLLADPSAAPAELEALRRTHRCPLLLTSAKSGLHVEEAFRELAAAIAGRRLVAAAPR